ncbi:hypothetical protein PMAYCL1PPCAC_22241, partial [Pristionchus mayeri]
MLVAATLLTISIHQVESIQCHQGYQGGYYTGPKECNGDACMIDVQPMLAFEKSQSCITNIDVEAGCWIDDHSAYKIKGCICKSDFCNGE